jgi:vacuolar iron transporter family protein
MLPKFPRWGKNNLMFHTIHHYLLTFVNEQKNKLSNFSFGAASAVITSLAIIISFDINDKSKLWVVGSLCVIALADNISDTLGIHIYQEGEFMSFRKVWRATLINFVTRLCVIVGFILFVLLLPPIVAAICSILYGYLILITISYLVARKRNIPPKTIILEHIIIATLVLVLSKYITYFIKLWV